MNRKHLWLILPLLALAAISSTTFTSSDAVHRLGGRTETDELYYGAARIYRTALTPVDAGTSLDFALTNRSWTLSLTGAVSLTTANLLAGKCGNILITNAQATNCAFTFPAWIFIGYKPTYITAGKCARIDLESTSTTDAATYAYYGEQQ